MRDQGRDYGRDESLETPLHKGFSDKNVRDGGFFVMKLSNTQHLFLNTRPLLNNKWLLAEKVPPWE